MLRSLRDSYEQVFSPANNNSDNSHGDQWQEQEQEQLGGGDQHRGSGYLAPLEVGSPSPLSTNTEAEDRGENNASLGDGGRRFFGGVDDDARIGSYDNGSNDGVDENHHRDGSAAHDQIFQLPHSVSLSPKQASWLLYLAGMVGMTFLNPLCCVLAMKYANPSILAPFSGLTLVWVVLFSGAAVGERPGPSQIGRAHV